MVKGRDYSVGNSYDNFLGVTAALAASEYGLARRLASLAWEPPDADYISPSSSCTPNDQHIASAVRHLFASEIDASLDELSLVRPTKRESTFVNHTVVARMIRGLACQDEALFLEGLHGMLTWHANTAIRKSNRNDPGFFLCLPALGLSMLAIQRGLIARDRLPADNPFLPLDLIDVGGDRGFVDAVIDFSDFDLWWIPDDVWMRACPVRSRAAVPPCSPPGRGSDNLRARMAVPVQTGVTPLNADFRGPENNQSSDACRPPGYKVAGHLERKCLATLAPVSDATAKGRCTIGPAAGN